jgi:hypothetical protein
MKTYKVLIHYITVEGKSTSIGSLLGDAPIHAESPQEAALEKLRYAPKFVQKSFTKIEVIEQHFGSESYGDHFDLMFV